MYEMHGQLIIISVTTATQLNLKNFGSPMETVTKPLLLMQQPRHYLLRQQKVVAGENKNKQMIPKI